MIGVSKLLMGVSSESDGLRYRDGHDASVEQIRHDADHVKSNKPIVVWNMTKQCNLKCLHCYATATTQPEEGELITEDAKSFMEDVARYKSPVFLFSGGEPLVRPDLFELIEYADSIGLRSVISTNGTLITEEKAMLAKKAGVMDPVWLCSIPVRQNPATVQVHAGIFFSGGTDIGEVVRIDPVIVIDKGRQV